ncbi:MAG: GTPase [Nocardioidaceae bacterium]
MTALVQGAKRLVGRGTQVTDRLDGLEEAVRLARGRLDPAVVDAAAAVVERSGARLRLSGDHTVVALAGATGSGKSTTFNALTGLDLAGVGVRRPTTSWTLACAWGTEGAGELLDWLGVPKRHQVSRDSMLDGPREDRDLDGLVLLDLPDHDSTEVAHHVEVDRLVALADLLVWVLDPQKYADAAVHDRYLKPFATHKGIMLVALNHIDTVPEKQRAGMVADLERLLKDDGLEGVPVLAISGRNGDGIPELKRMIGSRVGEKKATQARLLADVTTAATRLREANGEAKPGDVAKARRNELVDAFADAAGVPTVVEAVEKATRVRAARATGWPMVSWVSRLRPDPLKRLHLDLGSEGKELTGRARASLPQATQVQRARVDTAVRGVADGVSAELTKPWAEAVRRASVQRLDDVNDALDRAVTGTDLGVSRTPLWWHGVRFAQWLLILAAVGGAVWLGVLAVMGYLQVPQPSPPAWRGLPVPTFMLLGGVALGVVLAVLCRMFVGLAGRQRAAVADQRLRSAIGEVADRLVVEPVQAEVEAYRATRAALAQALR